MNTSAHPDSFDAIDLARRVPNAKPRAVIELAVRSQGYCAEMLERLAAEGDITTLLALFAQIGSPSCLWLEGDLAVELFEEDVRSVRVRVLEEVGGGMRERVLPAITLQVPLSEVLAEVYETPELLGDLRIERVSSRCAMLVLGAEDEAVPSSVFEISETCLSVPPPPPVASVEDLDRGWDEPLS
jgi:hypothetical protein